MILPNMWQIFKHYPYLLPLLVIILLLAAYGHMLVFVRRVLQKRNCPGCCENKTVCIVACERVSRRLNELEVETYEPIS